MGADANARDPFGPGGPGIGDPGTLSLTDLRIMDVLGWNLASTQPPPPLNLKFVGVGDFTAGGLADVAWQNGGKAALWVSNGSALTLLSMFPNSRQVRCLSITEEV